MPLVPLMKRELAGGDFKSFIDYICAWVRMLFKFLRSPPLPSPYTRESRGRQPHPANETAGMNATSSLIAT